MFGECRNKINSSSECRTTFSYWCMQLNVMTFLVHMHLVLGSVQACHITAIMALERGVITCQCVGMQIAGSHSGTLLCGLLHYAGYITKALHALLIKKATLFTSPHLACAHNYNNYIIKMYSIHLIERARKDEEGRYHVFRAPPIELSSVNRTV